MQAESTILAADPRHATALRPARAARRSAAGFMAWLGASFAITFALAWIYVAAMPMAFMSRDHPLWIAKRTMLDQCRLGSVSVFGDSRTLAATVPRVMPIPVANFAMSGTSPIETYFAVARAMRCKTLPKLVLIAHGALKFTSNSDYWVFSAKAGFLDYAEMRAVESNAARFPSFHFDSLCADAARTRRAVRGIPSCQGTALSRPSGRRSGNPLLARCVLWRRLALQRARCRRLQPRPRALVAQHRRRRPGRGSARPMRGEWVTSPERTKLQNYL